MSESSDNQQTSSKKGLHPLVWLILGVVIYALLQAWVFPKVGFPS